MGGLYLEGRCNVGLLRYRFGWGGGGGGLYSEFYGTLTYKMFFL